MAEQTDTGTETGQETAGTPPASPPSGTDYEAQVKHFQSIADKRDADNKSLKAELDALKATQEEATKKDLEEQKKFQELYTGSEQKVAELTAQAASLNLRVKLQEHLAEKHPDYAPDFRWIHPHVTSEEDIASVTEDYVKAHPRTPGSGAASPGNRGAGGAGQKTISKADLADPAKAAALLKEDPDLTAKIEKGEVLLI